jgi:hypothetical protein|tara:strand:- start:68 stop:280 length:213 start_codon:yes stop_codon:yes gene_type:complete
MPDNMDDLMDALVSNESPSQISDAIKDMLYAKTAEKVDSLRPNVASSLFGEDDLETNDEIEATPEVEDEE